MRLIAHELAGERGGEPVFSGVSFALAAGEALVVTGPNGAGKSTLLRVVAGLLPVAGGSVRLEAGGELPPAPSVGLQGGAERPGSMPPEGSAVRPLGGSVLTEGSTQLRPALPDAEGDPPSVASASHYLGHRDAMKPALNVTENLRFWCGLFGAGGLSADEALDQVGLAEISHAPFGYLSAGQKRRAAIARLLLSPRPLWLLDEPSAGLDAASESRLGALMQAHRAGGGIILAATHQPLGLEGARELRMGSAQEIRMGSAQEIRMGSAQELNTGGAPPFPLRGGSLREAERGGGAGG